MVFRSSFYCQVQSSTGVGGAIENLRDCRL